ncbi:Sodium/sulfate symporter [Halteromyces radiatus]|uniref:Sodium/sulfate symporter n=1 Tax=Halteromyces radiatus TaxID=101107 RepID=UPI00221EBFCA|nr:Sodium/sulfate symporter [Halteromyces radiatus]KAI8081661.1 Sodium/sulfate symporter [Halteromyces radiatus]
MNGLLKIVSISTLAKSKFISLLPSLSIGIAIWFGVSPNHDLTPTAIHLLAVFTSCIIALITTSIDISMLVLSGLILLAATQSFECTDTASGLSVECRLCGHINPHTKDIYECHASSDAFKQSLEGFSSSVVWLIFAAFHLGKAVQVTKLGRRLSLWMIALFGTHILGLAYAIVLSELLLAPFVPSNTARGGGIILPVVQSIATTLGSTPSSNPALGGFLLLVGSHANLLSASMYLTGMAPNPIVIAKANQLFPDLNFGFMTWLTGSIVPGLICAACLPYLLYRFCGIHAQEKQDSCGTDNITKHARMELESIGAMTVKEWQLCIVLLSCLGLWVTSSYTKLDSTLVALMGIVTLLHMGTIQWKDISTNTNAWDTLFWLGGFVTIAQQLSEAGASSFLGNKISDTIEHLSLPPVPCLAVAYFLTTFMFSSLSAHTVAFVATFLDAGASLGTQPQVLTAFLAYFGSLGGCMTNFSTGSAAMYYAPGYVSRSKWFSVGIKMAGFYLFIYFTIGLGWWKLLGWH